MKFYIVGVGGIGGFFGTLLANSGADVTFLMRESARHIVKKQGIELRTVRGNHHLPHPNVIFCAVEVANAEGIPFGDEEVNAAMQRLEGFRTKGEGSKTSLLKDIEARTGNEIESLSGDLIRIGRRHQLILPTHEQIYARIKSYENTLSKN